MHAVQLRARIEDEHDTNVDEHENAPAPRIRIRRKVRESEENEQKIELVAQSNEAVSNAPVQRARLDELRVRETMVRRAAQPIGREDPQQTQTRTSLIAIDFVRSQDKSQQISAEGSEIVVRGIATGAPSTASGPRLSALGSIAPLPVRSTARPVTVSVAIDGMVYAVRVSAGDTARDTVETLAERLSARWSVEIVEAGDERSRLVIGR